MAEPVVDCYGHRYEDANIRRWLRDHPSSPVNRKLLTPNLLAPDLALRGRIDRHPVAGPMARAARAALQPPADPPAPAPPTLACLPITWHDAKSMLSTLACASTCEPRREAFFDLVKRVLATPALPLETLLRDVDKPHIAESWARAAMRAAHTWWAEPSVGELLVATLKLLNRMPPMTWHPSRRASLHGLKLAMQHSLAQLYHL